MCGYLNEKNLSYSLSEASDRRRKRKRRTRERSREKELSSLAEISEEMDFFFSVVLRDERMSRKKNKGPGALLLEDTHASI